MENVTITVKQEINMQRIADILCSAVDPGYEAISYWGEVRSKTEPSAWTFEPEDSKHEKGHYRHYYPLNPGGSLTIRDNEADKSHHTLDLKAVKRGLQLMATKYPQHFADIINENDDNDTADALVQLALFGELIYG